MKYGLTLEQIKFILNNKNNRTKYEIEQNIYNEGAELIKESDGIQIWGLKKSDKTTTLVVVYRAGLQTPSNNDWFFLVYNKKSGTIHGKRFCRNIRTN